MAGGNNLNNNYFVQNVRAFDQDPESIDPLLGMVFWDTDVLGKVGELLTIKGPNYMVGNACASGNAALLCAIDLLRAGRVDTVVVSAATQELDPVALQGWALMDALVWQSFADAPTQASRPFDARRQGFVPGEGAGAVILETLAGARARDARIHAELLGGVSTCDATRLPKPVVDGQVRVMRGALRDASVTPEQVNYINAHGTSTVLADAAEVEAIKQVFGDHAYRIPINATKSMLGHCLTAAGLVELVALLVQMEDGYLHPTINLDEPEPGFGLDFVPHLARPIRHRDRDVEFVRLRRAQRLRGRGPSPIGMATEPEHAIDVEKLTKRYGDLLAVNDISFHVRTGEVFAFLGPNGAGKTTTVEIIETIRTPTSGNVRLLGMDVTTRKRDIVPASASSRRGSARSTGSRSGRPSSTTRGSSAAGTPMSTG